MARSKYEIKAEKELEAEGYTVDWKTRPFRVPKGYQVDFFGVFDLVAIRKAEPVRWISIKGHAGIPAWHRSEVANFWLPPESNVKEIWVYRKNKTWRKEIIPFP